MNKIEKNLIKKIKHIEYLWESYSQNHIQDIASLQSKFRNTIKKFGFTKEAENFVNCQNSIRSRRHYFYEKWYDLNDQLRKLWDH